MQILKEDFQVVVPGEIYPRTLKAGEEVSGRVAEMAAACGKLETSKAIRKAPENKAHRRAPETK